mgnify:CR=1 FL=1
MLAADEKSNKSGIKQLSHGQQGDTVVYSHSSVRTYFPQAKAFGKYNDHSRENILLYLPVGRVITVYYSQALREMQTYLEFNR